MVVHSAVIYFKASVFVSASIPQQPIYQQQLNVKNRTDITYTYILTYINYSWTTLTWSHWMPIFVRMWSPTITMLRQNKGDQVSFVASETGDIVPCLPLQEQVATLPTRSTTSISMSGEQQDALQYTSVMFSLLESRVVFMVPFPCLRVTRSTPVPSAPSVTRLETSHILMLQLTEQLVCRLSCSHTGALKSVT